MKVVHTVSDLRSALALPSVSASTAGTVGLVPTMGALHAGHVSLVAKARKTTDTVIVSVFVNPTQFNDPADLQKYPRTLEADCELLEQAGADIVFAPSVDDMYPNGMTPTRTFDFGPLDKVMEGAMRPGHFAGVAQVVDRLFTLVGPTHAFFGEKDFQQLAIIREMELQRGGAIQIIGCPIIRSDDGLALSSRNALLSVQERDAAPQIYRAISQATQQQGATKDLIAQLTQTLNALPHLKVEYIEIVDRNTLQPLQTITPNAHLCATVHCGTTRLIDNIAFSNATALKSCK